MHAIKIAFWNSPVKHKLHLHVAARFLRSVALKDPVFIFMRALLRLENVEGVSVQSLAHTFAKTPGGGYPSGLPVDGKRRGIPQECPKSLRFPATISLRRLPRRSGRPELHVPG
jgi:hypothetical protein